MTESALKLNMPLTSSLQFLSFCKPQLNLLLISYIYFKVGNFSALNGFSQSRCFIEYASFVALTKLLFLSFLLLPY